MKWLIAVHERPTRTSDRAQAQGLALLRGPRRNRKENAGCGTDVLDPDHKRLPLAAQKVDSPRRRLPAQVLQRNQRRLTSAVGNMGEVDPMGALVNLDLILQEYNEGMVSGGREASDSELLDGPQQIPREGVDGPALFQNRVVKIDDMVGNESMFDGAG